MYFTKNKIKLVPGFVHGGFFTPVLDIIVEDSRGSNGRNCGVEFLLMGEGVFSCILKRDGFFNLLIKAFDGGVGVKGIIETSLILFQVLLVNVCMSVYQVSEEAEGSGARLSRILVLFGSNEVIVNRLADEMDKEAVCCVPLLVDLDRFIVLSMHLGDLGGGGAGSNFCGIQLGAGFGGGQNWGGGDCGLGSVCHGKFQQAVLSFFEIDWNQRRVCV